MPSSTSATRSVLDRLFAFALQRDGQAEALQRDAIGPAPAAAAAAIAAAVDEEEAAAPPRRQPPPAQDPQRVLREVLATKALHAWLQNRHQTLFPLTLNLRVLDPGARALLVRLVAASAAMALDGGAEPGRLGAALDGAGAGEAERRLLAEALAAPAPLPPLLDALREAGLGAYAYAAALLALGRRGPVECAWLDFLAARFALPAEVTGDLERRSGGGSARRRR
jgi:uncharacterized protein DUF533